MTAKKYLKLNTPWQEIVSLKLVANRLSIEMELLGMGGESVGWRDWICVRHCNYSNKCVYMRKLLTRIRREPIV